MTAPARKTNADLVRPAVDMVKTRGGELARHFREHPDELAVAVAPFLMLALATRRHNLNFAEAALISECSFWGGVLAVQAYQTWKDKPAGQPLRRVK